MLLPDDSDHPLADAFRDLIRDRAFPCVGAKSALAKGQIAFVVARDMASAWDDLRIYPGLLKLAEGYRAEPKLFQSFVVLFEGPNDLSEAQFESLLWERAQSLSDKDAWHGQQYDPRVSPDADDPHFSLSFGGEGFFIVGLHPNASRPARRFVCPALVFNMHDQFEQLRTKQIYERMRETIIERDVALAGTVNPMLARHGDSSEARQYSGRIVDEAWRCPFSADRKLTDAA